MDSQNKLDLQGKLNLRPLAEILVEISHNSLSGALRLENGERKIAVYFEDGEIVFIASNARKHKFFEILLGERKITVQQLSDAEDFVNDFKFKEFLLSRGLLSQAEIRDAFARQFDIILRDTLAWTHGNWFFTPLARVRDEMRQPFDFYELLLEYGRNLSSAQTVQRFKSFREIFRLRKNLPDFELRPEEAFLMSRLEDGGLTVENMRDLSGLSDTETFRLLYGLWLGGFLKRENWNAAFSEEKLRAINSAKLTLKTPAAEADKSRAETVFPQPVSENTKKETAEEKTPEQEEQLTLEQYLEQMQTAENYYERLGVAPEVSETQIKTAYFALAKSFHPDLFYRQVEAAKHKEIQDAFTSIAQAYDTLRNKETREVYDYKMRKNIEFKSQKVNADGSVTDGAADESENQAAQIFEYGFALLMDENFEQALPYLARAAALFGDNAKYRAYYGRALSENDKKHQAEAEFQAAVRLEPENIDYRLMLVRFFIEIRLFKRAEGEIKRLLEIAPDNYEAKTLLDSLPINR